MPTLGLIIEPSTTPSASRSTDRALLAAAVATGEGTLRISGLPGDVLALGRWHRAPAGAPDVTLHRRLSGGRAAASGAGFLHLTLALPHRAALVSDDAFALAPEQILNRAVRGLLGALEAAGLSPVYPGRDLVTIAGRPIAVLGLELDGAGGTLVEAVLSVDRDQSLLPRLLDRSDPDGTVAAPMILPDDVTSLTRALGRTPPLDEVAAWLEQGFASRLAVRLVEQPAPRIAGGDDGAFVGGRGGRLAHDRSARAATMLGVLEAHVGRSADGRLAEVVLAGDFFAPSPTIERLERALRGCAPTVDAIQTVVDAVIRPPEHFVLGVGPLRTVAETIAQAAR